MDNKTNKPFKYIYTTILFLITTLVVFFSMVISPKYSMVYSQYNQSVFYIIGKLMKEGKIPYVDFIDHKEPYLYIFHYFAEFFNNGKHIGLFVLGVIFIFITALFMYKTFLLLFDILNDKNGKNDNLHIKNIISLLSSILIVILISSYNISYGTLQCETFVTAFLSIVIYLFVNDTYKYGLLSYKTIFIYGCIFSFILFLKPNYNIIFLYVLIFIIKNIKKVDIKKYLLYGILGVVLIALPIIIHSLINNYFSAMIENYFILNMKYSSAPYAGTKTKFESFLITINELKIYYFLILCSLLLIIYNKRKLNKDTYDFLICSMILLTLSTLLSLRPYTYYLIVLMPYIGILFFLILNIIENVIGKFISSNILIKNVSYALILLIITLSFINLNKKIGIDPMIKNGKEQVKIAKKLNEIIKNRQKTYIKDYSVFVAGRGLYMYEYLDKLPIEKYFYMPVIDHKYYEEPYIETINYIKEKRNNIVIIDFTNIQSKYFYENGLNEIFERNYRVVGSYYDRIVYESK